MWAEATSTPRRLLLFREFLVDNVVENGSFETGNFTGWFSWGPIYVERDGYRGQYCVRCPANRYAGYISQTLPISDFNILMYAFRFRSPWALQQYGGVYFSTDGSWSGLRVYVEKATDDTLTIWINEWNGTLKAPKDAEGWYDTGWHTLAAVKATGNNYNVYLDGERIVTTTITPTNKLVVHASGGTTSALEGYFLFDEIIVG